MVEDIVRTRSTVRQVTSSAGEAMGIGSAGKQPKGAGRNGRKKRRTIETLCPDRLALAKFAYTTRRVPREDIAGILPAKRHPNPGDLVLAEVVTLGQHEHLELIVGRKAQLYPGDEIVVAYGNRYAPDQFEAIVPETLSACHLVAAGGIASRMIQKHAKMKNPTVITPIGLLGNSEGRRINLAGFGLEPMRPVAGAHRPLTIVIAGTSMNSGKTTVISCLTRGLVCDGHKVAAAKISGTGSGGDPWQMIDAGANPVLDFVDAGVASTYRLAPDEMNRVRDTLLAHLFQSEVDVVLLEISDGLLEPETARLLASSDFRAFIDAVVFTASDAMGAAAGISWLRKHNLPVVAVSGLLTRSPLAMREALASTEIPVHRTDSFVAREVAAMVIECVAIQADGAHSRFRKKLPRRSAEHS